MPYNINQFNRVYRNGCAYPLPSRITIVATYIQSAISVSMFTFEAVVQYTCTGNSNITVNRHDFKFSLVGFDRNYSEGNP